MQIKELLHILDDFSDRANTRDEVEALIREITLHHVDLEDVTDPAAISDLLAVLYALAVVVPRSARELLLSKFEAGQMTLPQIAGLLDLPLHYVTYVMSDDWSKIYPRIMGILQKNERWSPIG